MAEWQPIATAPTDGTRVLLGRVGVHAMHTAFWRDDLWRTGNLGYFNNPTHWMPLPAPPADEARDASIKSVETP
jgi:hypothetical protein